MALTEIPSELSYTPCIVGGGNAAALTIDSSQNVGIGVSSPQRTLVLGKGDSTGVQTQYTNSTTGAALGDGFTVGIDGSENAEFWNFENTNMLFATNGTERIRITSAGNLLVNTSSFSSLGTLVIKQLSDTKGLALVDDGSANTFFIQNLGSEARISHNDTSPMTFLTNSTERMRILPTGGITFNGDTAQANALNDYEEGTWTAAISGMGIATNRASYTKVGRLVKVDFSLTVTSASTSATAAAITGIPFISSSNTDSESVGGLMLLNFTADTNTVSINSYVYSRSGGVFMYQIQSNNTAWITVKPNDLVVGSAIIGSVIYQTT